MFLSSCTESQKKENVEIKFDSLIYDETGKLFTGKKSGKVGDKKIEYEVVNGKKNGTLKIFGTNDKVEVEGSVKENKNEGLWKYYFHDGKIESQGNFKNDLVDGEWFWNYPSGKLKETAVYKDGLREGQATTYDEQGNIIAEKNFQNGIEVKDDKIL